MLMKITDNFTFEELIHSDTAIKYGIDNIPEPEELATMIQLCETVLQPIRDVWQGPIKINSCYRCKKLNTKVGGAKNSAHLYGAGADITVGNKDKNKQLFNTILSMIDRKQIQLRTIIDEYDYKWLHLDINCEGLSYRENYILHLK